MGGAAGALIAWAGVPLLVRAAPDAVAGGFGGAPIPGLATAGLDLNVPFGGVKDSSTNTFREQGKSALDFFTWGKTVYTGV